MGRRSPAFQMNTTALLAGLFSGIIASMGMGGGAVLIIYLSVFTTTEQLTAQGINLLFFVPIGLISVIIYTVRKKIKFKKIILLMIFGVIGSFIGIFITGVINSVWLTKGFGIFLIVLGLKEIFIKSKTKLEKNGK